MRRNGLIHLVGIVVLAVGGLAYTLIADNEPLLGLDLQGGVSVVYQPADSTEANDEAFDQSIEIIRNRVDGLGVAEPEIARQGDAVIVSLPGVDDPDRVLDLIGQTAELRFRPVLTVLPPLGAIEGELEDDGATDESTDDTTTTTTVEETTTTTEAGDEESGLGIVADGESAMPALPAQEDTTTTTVAGDEPAEGDEPVEGDQPAEGDEPADIGDLLGEFELTPPSEDIAENPVVLAEYDSDGNEVARYQLGPTLATGEIVDNATARLTPGTSQWTVELDFKGGAAGSDQFDAIAAQCVNGSATCPTRQLAIVLDSRVETAPVIQQARFDGSAVISNQNSPLSEGEAKDLALVLQYGSLPVELEPQDVRQVSATIGEDSLTAGLVAGLIGLLVVALYMIVYYRLLGVIAMLSLAISAALLWTIVAYIGENQGLALTLAGVTGIIVSIGVAVDSNVVFYENLKEGHARGRTLRSAVDGSFRTSFSTIVKADVASLIGAGVLYFLTVGPVRGFALFLGLSTILDIVSSYFFMRPLATTLVKSPRFQDRDRWFGMPPLGSIDEHKRVATPEEVPA